MCGVHCVPAHVHVSAFACCVRAATRTVWAAPCPAPPHALHPRPRRRTTPHRPTTPPQPPSAAVRGPLQLFDAVLCGACAQQSQAYSPPFDQGQVVPLPPGFLQQLCAQQEAAALADIMGPVGGLCVLAGGGIVCVCVVSAVLGLRLDVLHWVAQQHTRMPTTAVTRTTTHAHTHIRARTHAQCVSSRARCRAAVRWVATPRRWLLCASWWPSSRWPRC
jgi:hypothetical protein